MAFTGVSSCSPSHGIAAQHVLCALLPGLYKDPEDQVFLTSFFSLPLHFMKAHFCCMCIDNPVLTKKQRAQEIQQ